MVRQDNTHDYSVGKIHPLSKRADCRSKYSKKQITCTRMENTAESYCAETNLKGYFLNWFPVHFCRLRLRTMRKNENCARKAQVANTKFACRKSAMKKFAPQLRTCGFCGLPVANSQHCVLIYLNLLLDTVLQFSLPPLISYLDVNKHSNIVEHINCFFSELSVGLHKMLNRIGRTCISLLQ